MIQIQDSWKRSTFSIYWCLFPFLVRFTCTLVNTWYITPNYSYLPLESPTITWCMGAPISQGEPQNVNILGPHGAPILGLQGPRILKIWDPAPKRRAYSHMTPVATRVRVHRHRTHITKQCPECNCVQQTAKARHRNSSGSGSRRNTVGHVPREIWRVCWYSLARNNTITCKVRGHFQNFLNSVIVT